MESYSIEITLKSPTLIGSGEGYGVLIDSDIVLDEFGIPYIPAKRIKGCLRDSAIDVCHMLKNSGIYGFIGLKEKEDCPDPYDKNRFEIVTSIFGFQGDKNSSPLYFSNLFIENYELTREWIRYLIFEYPSYFNKESVTSTFTEIRQQTAVEEGIAKKHSLRTIRVIKSGIKFKGEINYEGHNRDGKKLLSLACANLRHLGTKRNRGFGEVECKIFDSSKEISFFSDLEGLCLD